MNKKIKKIIFILSCFLFFVFISNIAVAGVGNLSDAFKVDDGRVYGEKDRLDSAAYNMGFDVGRSADQGGASPERVIALIISTVLSLLGVVFIILIIYGGILWMTAGGNDQQIEKSKKIITRSIIGLSIALLAYVISVFIINIFVSPSPADNSIGQSQYSEPYF